jgi:hypothetical protein
MSTDLQPSPCTNCGKINDAATYIGSGKETPSPGDISICYYCSHIMAFDEKLKLRELTDAEIIEVAGDPRLILASDALAMLRKEEK